jgi:hypothetical protein
MARLAVVAALATLAIPALARAQSAPAAEPAPTTGDRYSEGTALALSLGVTAAGVATVAVRPDNDVLMTAGLMMAYVGPSAGHLYTGELFTRGLGVRTLGVVATLTGAMIAFSDCGLFAPQPCEESPVGPTIAVLGVAAYAAGTIDDILTAPGRAARMNRAAATRVTLAPRLAPGRAGVAVVGTF